MAKPVNDITGDAPDSTNPDKKYVPEKTGRFKYTPPPPPKPDPRDANIFTEEKLRRSGGKMKEPPMDIEGKKRGGSIKARRYSPGGEIMDEYNGAMGRGTDTPDKKIAREKSDAAYESDAADKTAGLKGSKGEDVGFFKRLMMGNIDKPGSEAYEKFGAGRGRSDAAREDANKSARNKQENDRNREANVLIDSAKSTDKEEAKPIKQAEKDTSYPDIDAGYVTSYNNINKQKPVATKPKVPAATKPSPAKPTTASTRSLAGEPPPEAPAASASNRGNSFDVPAAPKSARAEIPTSAASKAPASTGQDTSGPSIIESLLVGTGITAGLGAAGATGVKAYKAYKAAQAAKRAKEAAYRPEPNVLTGKDYSGEAQAAADAFRKTANFKRGGATKAYAKGGSVSGRSPISASSRGDGCAQRGKTRGTMR